jgi:hypothetical protein
MKYTKNINQDCQHPDRATPKYKRYTNSLGLDKCQMTELCAHGELEQFPEVRVRNLLCSGSCHLHFVVNIFCFAADRPRLLDALLHPFS